MTEDMIMDAAGMWYRDKDRNCAEALLCAGRDCYQLELSSEALRAAGGFGGGMGIGSVCGALTGSLMVMGPLFVAERSHESEDMKEVRQWFFELAQQRLGSIDCESLKDRYYHEDTKCLEVVRLAAQILHETAEQFSHLRKR